MQLTPHSHGVSKEATGRIRQKNEEIILQAAEEEFALHGFKGASMQAIAERAGLPKANIHYYFKNKLSLYAGVLSQVIDLWDTTLNELNENQEPAEVLPLYIAEKIRFSRDYPQASRVFAKEILSGAPLLKDYFSNDYQAWFESRVEVFRAWIKQGKMDSVDPAHLVFLIWSSTQHYADFAVQIEAAIGKSSLEETDYDAATQTLIKVILNGCGIRLQANESS